MRAFEGGVAVADSLRAVLARDLDYSDRFVLAELPASLASGPVQYRPLNDLGVVFLVTGEVAEEPGGGTRWRVAVHDVVYGFVKEARTFRLPPPSSPDFRLAVHAVADEVVRWMTGQPGGAASRIAVVRRLRDGRSELLVVDSDGEDERRVLVSEERVLSPAWSPDGKRLAYVVGGAGGWRIYERELETGATRLVAGRPGTMAITPAYAPDGRRIAFAMEAGGGLELYEYDVAQGCCLRRIARSPRDDLSPTFSPDGRRIAFNSNRLGTPHIFVMPAEGGQPTLLSPYAYDEPGYYTSPDWSPAGSLVAFALGRRYGRPWVERRVRPDLRRRFEARFAGRYRAGWVVFWLMLLPAFPRDPLCYLAGLTDLRARHFALIAAVGRPAGLVPWVALGAGQVGSALALQLGIFAVAVVLWAAQRAAARWLARRGAVGPAPVGGGRHA